ncbi:hypothetical protein [Leisingera sp. S232]|uniref:hypothetical protein n=1 Tax=Leisingera sp. S232 TaxID=3415132 RepID=UPI003C7E69B0
MPKTPLGRSWPLIEKISPKAAALLQEANELESMTIDFSDIFETSSLTAVKDGFPSACFKKKEWKRGSQTTS